MCSTPLSQTPPLAHNSDKEDMKKFSLMTSLGNLFITDLRIVAVQCRIHAIALSIFPVLKASSYWHVRSPRISRLALSAAMAFRMLPVISTRLPWDRNLRNNSVPQAELATAARRVDPLICVLGFSCKKKAMIPPFGHPVAIQFTSVQAQVARVLTFTTRL